MKQARLRLTRGVLAVAVTRLVVLIPVCLGLRIIACSARAGVVAAVRILIACARGSILSLIWGRAGLRLHAWSFGFNLRARRNLIIVLCPWWGILTTHDGKKLLTLGSSAQVGLITVIRSAHQQRRA